MADVAKIANGAVDLKSIPNLHIALTIKTKDFSATSISDNLGIQPDNYASAGESTRTLATGATVRTGLHTWTSWSRKFEVQNSDIEQTLIRIIVLCEPHKAFLKKILRGKGLVQAQLRFPGTHNVGNVLSAEVLGKLADLGVSLSLEVFPESMRISRNQDGNT